MRSIFGLSLFVVPLVSALTVTSAFAITCSDRKQVCLAYCEKHYKSSPKCRDVCGELLNTCMATGCWESKITAKRCGISKQ
jgi:hypothetical protein